MFTAYTCKFHGGGIAEFSLKYRPLFFQSVCDSNGLNYLCGRIYTLIIKTQRNMEISNSTKAYKTPQVKVLEVKVQGVLCLSGENGQTEGFTVNRGNAIGEDDWE